MGRRKRASNTVPPASTLRPAALAADTCGHAPEGWWCSRDVDHEGPCALRKVLPVLDEVEAAQLEAVARAIAGSRLMGIPWVNLTPGEQEDYRADALTALRAAESHAEGHTWLEVVPAGRAAAYVECADCGATGWVLEPEAA